MTSCTVAAGLDQMLIVQVRMNQEAQTSDAAAPKIVLVERIICDPTSRFHVKSIPQKDVKVASQTTLSTWKVFGAASPTI